MSMVSSGKTAKHNLHCHYRGIWRYSRNFLESDGGVSGALVVHWSNTTQGDGNGDDSKSDQRSEETLQTDIFAVWSNVVDVTAGTANARSNTDSWSTVLITLRFVAAWSFVSFHTSSRADSCYIVASSSITFSTSIETASAPSTIFAVFSSSKWNANSNETGN